jgi:signal transduction histidine kinase
MRERIMERGGSLQFVSEKGAGFSVKVDIPLQQQSWKFGGTGA